MGAEALGGLNYQVMVDTALDDLADGVEAALDVAALFELAAQPALIARAL